MTQAVVRQFRERRSGMIVNVTSSATLAPMPLVSVYTASKMAISGFTASLGHELAAFGIGVKLIEPGYAPTTKFIENSDVQFEEAIPPAYLSFAQPILATFERPRLVTTEADVAETIWTAVTDGSDQLHYPAGPDAVELAKAA